MITLRPYDPDHDYPTIAEWWHGPGHDPVPKVVLPALGAIAVRTIRDKQQDVAAAWCYQDNSTGVALMEWIISKPETSGVILKSAFEAITDYFKEDLKANGYTVLAAHCHSEQLASVLSLNGFARIETVEHMIMGI